MNRNQLFQVADRQQGYFTALQAQECGISRSNFHRQVESGEWIKECRGIYRLAHYPVINRPELVLYSLWSCNRSGEVQGTWSHVTALDIYDLSDVMPSKMHLTVPKKFRRRSKIPAVLCLYYTDLKSSDIECHQGYRVTTPIKTLMDVASERTLSPDLIVQSIEQALERGLISRGDLTQSKDLLRIVDEYEI